MPWQPISSPSRASRVPGALRGLTAIALTTLAAAAALPVRPARAFGVAIQTGLAGYPPSGTAGDAALALTRRSGAHFQRLAVEWSKIAPTTPQPDFQPSSPEDPGYRWTPLDETVASVVSHGLEPVIDIVEPPSWAQAPPASGTTRPDPLALAAFAQAAASRYDGSRPGLPRVSYWEVWNEPNASFFLEPQLEGSRIVSVDAYRTMLEDFSSAVHAVHADNVVIGGALFPNGLRHATATAIAPLDFTRRIFCLTGGTRPRLACRTRVDVDAWSVHPYTSGGPATRPADADNVWIANLGALSSAVRAAQRLGTLISRKPAQTWVSEFSWDSRPPDPAGVPTGLEKRWVPEAIYQAWRASVSVFSWFRLTDQPLDVSPFQSGLYFACPDANPCEWSKPAISAFRFPFVAFARRPRRALVWGRTPAGVPGRVRVQWLSERGWSSLTTLASDADGIFTAIVALPAEANPNSSKLRAVQLGIGASPPFSLHRPPDIAVTPFGS